LVVFERNLFNSIKGDPKPREARASSIDVKTMHKSRTEREEDA
jgi:hypothetical protein